MVASLMVGIEAIVEFVLQLNRVKYMAEEMERMDQEVIKNIIDRIKFK